MIYLKISRHSRQWEGQIFLLRGRQGLFRIESGAKITERNSLCLKNVKYILIISSD
jgi:hypothetical protein